MPKFPRKSFSGVADKYADDIIAGKISACVQIKQAAKRFKDDFSRKDIVFRQDRVDHVCNFVQALVHVKGQWAGQPIKLEPFQVFILSNLFGWLEADTGLRRYRQAFILLPRKNGKSLLAAAVALYMVFADNESGAEGYIGATSMDQANEVFSPAKRMVEMSDGLAEALDIEVMAQSIFSTASGSSFKRVIAKTKDGSSPHCAISDEIHQSINDQQLNAFRTGMGSRRQPMLIMISTAGENLAGVCRSEQNDAEAVLSGRKKNDRLFAAIYTIDPGDDWKAVSSWKKANPNWGVSVGEAYLRDQLNEARQSPAKQAALRTKHLNEWISGAKAWLSPDAWEAAADRTLKLSDFHGETIHVGVDISTRQDLTAVAVTIQKDGKLLIFPATFLPSGAMESSPNAPAYREWIDQGYLTETPGSASSFEELMGYLEYLRDNFRVRKVIFDPWQGEGFRQRVESWGIDTVVMPSHAPAQWTSILDEFEADLKNNFIQHTGDPVLTWCANNISIFSKGGVSRVPVKPDDKNLKIDAMIVALTSFAISKAAPQPVEIVDIFVL